MKKINLLIFFLFLLIWACRKDTDIFIPYEEVPSVSSFVTGAVGGAIINEFGIPQANATVKLETKTNVEEMMTDENGIFYFRNVEINAERTYLLIESESYGNSSRAFTPRESGTEFLKIQLMTPSILDSISATQGGLFDVVGGASVAIPANALVNNGGSPFTDAANIGARYFNPVFNNLVTQLPGTLMALNSNNEQRALATFGLLDFELASIDGEPIQLAADKKATLRFPIPDELMDNSPAFIPMWYFDESTGWWMEEGQAEKDGTYYIGEAGQAKLWTVAMSYNPIRMSASIAISETNISYPNAFSKLTVVDGGVCMAAYTDGAGVIDGYIPAGQVLRFEIFDECGYVVYSSEIGPLSTDIDFSEILVEAPNSNVVQVNGTLNCSGDPITEGYVKLEFNESSTYYFANANGEFSTTIVACNFDEFEITGVDLINHEISETNSYLANEVIDTGGIDVCE